MIVRALADDEVEQVGEVLGLARLYQGDGFYLIAWDDGEPLGHLHLALTDPPELQDVMVRAEYRRRGVAAALNAAAEREVRDRGFDVLTLTVSATNDDGHAFYAAAGYTDTGAPPKRVKGTVEIRTGPIEVDDVLLTWAKRLDASV